jgi:glycosyltransferase involved in cell wall biosynthesis
MKSALKRLAGADKPRIIAVIATTRREVELAIAHARTADAQIPIRAWCAEEGATARQVRRELRASWPALSIVAWTGRRSNAGLKLVALTVPPFRVAAFNEAGDFFAVTLGPVAAHVKRRSRDAWNLLLGAVRGALRSFFYRAGERIRDVAWLGYSVVLEILTVAAAVAAPLARIPIGGRTADISEEHFRHPADKTYSEIVFSGRAWPARKFRHAIVSGASFIVLRRAGEKADPEPLIDLAIETGSFAVARQIAFTGWRSQVLNKHPFRTLQPGETAQVFAPWSTLIVIRREMLETLGAPHAVTIGAALMLMFWKAAAHGWRSLAVGHGNPITQEPAMPLEDLEFRLRVSGELTANRARGNVASSPQDRKPFRGLPRVLVVSPYLPYPLSHGGAVRIYNLCRALSNDLDFVLACFHEANERICYPELHEVFREVYTVDIDEKHAGPEVPKQVAEYRNTAMRSLVRDLCVGKRVDLLQLEYTQMAEYRDDSGSVPVILVEHDITFTLHRQLKSPESDLWLDFERKALQCVNAVWTMSQHDRGVAIAHGAPRSTTAVIPNGVDLLRFRPEPPSVNSPSILFVGSFRHMPNLLAFEALRQTIMPAVWREIPDCRLHVIAGPDHERAAILAGKRSLFEADDRIAIRGFVEDVRPAYRECTAVAVPLPVSAGTNIKLIEAMACGRAVVSTPVGCQGLELTDGLELSIREAGPEFAAALVNLLRDRAYRERMAAEARMAAERRFGWNAIARDALESALSAARPLARAVSESEYREWRKSGDSAIRNTYESPVRR